MGEGSGFASLLTSLEMRFDSADMETEAWGEDIVLTSHMGVAYASGLSKNSTWSDPDAVVPVMKVCSKFIKIH